MGNGTIGSPFSLDEAIQYVGAGDVLLLQDGVYSGTKTLRAVGTSNDPIIIMPAPGARPKLNGSLILQGAYWRIIGMEIYSAGWDRTVGNGLSSLSMDGDSLEAFNCILHDNAQGVTGSAAKSNLFMYGCHIFHNGWMPSGGDVLGHGTYIQNASTSIFKKIQRCIVHNNGYGLHFWGSAGEVNKIWIEECTSFGGGWIWRNSNAPSMLVGGQSANQGHRVYNSILWDGHAQIGYGVGNDVTDVQATGNIFDTNFNLIECVPDVLSDNEFYGPRSATNLSATPYSVDSTFPDNIFSSAGNCPDFVRVYGNDYDENLGQVIISNQQALDDFVSVDVGELYEAGDEILVMNAQDRDNDQQLLTVDSNGFISVDMQASSHTVIAPEGTGYFQVAPKIYPARGAFFMERQ